MIDNGRNVVRPTCCTYDNLAFHFCAKMRVPVQSFTLVYIHENVHSRMITDMLLFFKDARALTISPTS